jgi:hypothetical protein
MVPEAGHGMHSQNAAFYNQANGRPAGPLSGLYPVNRQCLSERGARLARRDDREYREYLREEQRAGLRLGFPLR